MIQQIPNGKPVGPSFFMQSGFGIIDYPAVLVQTYLKKP